MNSRHISLIVLVVLTALAGCSGSEFAGSPKTNSPQGAEGKPKTPGTGQGGPEDPDPPTGNPGGGGGGGGVCIPTPNPTTTPGLEGGDGSGGGCVDSGDVDLTATKTFAANRDVRYFVNNACKTAMKGGFSGAESVASDQATAQAVCMIEGYRKAVITKSSSYRSPGDNAVYVFSGTTQTLVGKFSRVPAKKSNNYIDGLTCSEKLKPQCVPKLEQLKCD